MDPPILARKSDQVSINKKKQKTKNMDFTVLANHSTT